MTAPRNVDDWARLLQKGWERRAQSGSRDFFVASHPGWRDPKTWERYARGELELMLTELAPDTLAGFEVLELGCGSGRLAELLEPMIHGYTGIDIAPSMVEAARARCKDMTRTRFFPCDGKSVPAEARDRSYDLVLSVAVFIHCPKEVIAALIGSAWALLQPGGQLRFQVLADRDDLSGLQIPVPAESEPTEPDLLAQDVATVVDEMTDEERELSSEPHYLGHEFRYDEVGTFVTDLTGVRPSLYRGDPAAIYALAVKPD